MAPRPSTPLKRRIVDAFTQRLALKGIAVVLAIGLWFIASAKEPTEAPFPVKFEPELDSSLVLRDPVPTIQALVAGPSRELLKLAVSPLVIHRHIDADSPDTLVLDLRPGDVSPPPGVSLSVEDLQPRSIVLHFETTSTRRVPVRSSVAVTPTPPGVHYFVRFEPESVEVSGPRRTVARVSSVATVRAVVPADDSLPHLVDLDTAHIDGLRVKPTQVKVHVGQTIDTLVADSARRADSIRAAAAATAPGATDALRGLRRDSALRPRRDTLPSSLTTLPVRPRRDSFPRRPAPRP